MGALFGRVLTASFQGGILILAVLVLLNTYPLLMSQNLMFRSQQTALQNQAVLVTNSLTTADQLTPEGVEAAIAPLEDLEVERILVTDEAGLVLYDTAEDSIAGKFALTMEVVAALEGKDHFISEYEEGIFSSRASAPVLNRNTVIGAVCLYEWDSSQGMLLEELQQNLLKFCQARLSVATLDQIASAALYDVGPEYFEAVRREYKLRRDTCFKKLLH